MTKGLKRVKIRLSHWFGLAEARHIWEGKAWYREAHEFAMQLTETYEIPIYRVVGVIAALSPSVRWEANKEQAENLCKAYVGEGSLSKVVLTTYGPQARKAQEILKTGNDFEDVTFLLGRRAFKTISFFSNILCYPNSLNVTIDQHIIDAAGYSGQWTQGARGCYDLLTEAITQLAEEANLMPCEYQAIIWVTYKDLTDRKQYENLPF